MSQEAQKMLVAKNNTDGEEMGFTSTQLEEAKQWLWDSYKKSSYSIKDPDDWFIDEIQAGKNSCIEYTLDPEDFFSAEQVDFVNFLIAEEYCDQERKTSLLQLLEGSKYEINFKREKRKKQKTVAEAKN